MLHKKRKPSTFTNNSSNMKVNTTNNLLHSKSTYFYRWFSNKKSIEGHSFSNTTYLIPSVCGVALLVGIGLVFNPVNSMDKTLLGESSGSAYAETVTANPTDYSSISMTLSNSGAELDSDNTVSTNVTPGLVSYINNDIKVSTTNVNRFYIAVQATEDSTSELIGTAHGETIASVAANTTTDNFIDNTWGFSLTDASTNSNPVYNPLPTYNTAITPQYSSESSLADGEYNLKLTFAAKINADKPSDHYTTKAMVSVAADARYISGFINLDTDQPITTMQEMTSSICKNAPDGYSTQLVDDRTASGLGQTTYWVTKLKDGNCWMTQNLDLALAEGDVLVPEDTDATAEYAVPALDGYDDPGLYVYTAAGSDLPSSGDTSYSEPYFTNVGTGYTASQEIMTSVISGTVYDAHYLVGNLYPYTIAGVGTITEEAGDICPKGWRLPTRAEYDALINGLTKDTIRKAPYYFVPAGFFNGNLDNVLKNIGRQGYYWSSTLSGSGTYNMYFKDNTDPTTFNSIGARTNGFSVRCVAK